MAAENPPHQKACRKEGCRGSVPPALGGEGFCLEHFLEAASSRTNEALNRCRQGRNIDSKSLALLLTDALAIVQNLEEGAAEPNADERERMLDLLLVVANVHEYVAHDAKQRGPLGQGSGGISPH